jgi:L-iditol 2-dehydrogenase
METVSRAFAEDVVGPAKKFYKLPDHAIQVTGLKPNDKVAVTSAGPIGLAGMQLAPGLCGPDHVKSGTVYGRKPAFLRTCSQTDAGR